MLSRYLHFGVLENYVSSLFLLSILRFYMYDYQCVMHTQQILKNKAMKNVSAFVLW